MSKNILYNLIIYELIIISSIKLLNCFYALPFETIFIKDETIEQNDFHTNLIQNELFINLTMGKPEQQFKSILKMDVYGFIIYENALNYSLSNSYEIVDEELRISWLYNYNSTPSKDNFYLPEFNSYKNFNNKKYDIKKTNKATFLRIEQKSGTSNNFNKMFYNYGIIGLKLNSNSYFNAPEFVSSLKDIKEIKNYIFSLKFENNLINGFSDINNKGYFIVGEDLIDDEKEKEEIQYSHYQVFGGTMEWDLNFDKIYTKFNDNNNIKNEGYIQMKKTANILVNYPYMVGDSEYFLYIKENFFNELENKGVCTCNNFIYDRKYYSYICDSKSEYFMNSLKNNFPDLIFEHKELGMNFTLTKNDLFVYNSFNKSDTNLYFLILNNSDVQYTYYTWIIGIPFLKKYRLSFNYESKNIGFYKNDGKIIEKNKEKSNFFKSIFFKIVIIIILIIIIFALGMIFQKNFKKARKKKANELDDDNYEYESYKENGNNNEYINKDDHNKMGIEAIN